MNPNQSPLMNQACAAPRMSRGNQPLPSDRSPSKVCSKGRWLRAVRRVAGGLRDWFRCEDFVVLGTETSLRAFLLDSPPRRWHSPRLICLGQAESTPPPESNAPVLPSELPEQGQPAGPSLPQPALESAGTTPPARPSATSPSPSVAACCRPCPHCARPFPTRQA